MSNFFTPFKKFLSLFFALFLAIGVVGNKNSFGTLDSENVRLNVTLFADVHMEGNCKPRCDVFTKSLQSLGGSEDKIDALALLGDNTMNGQDIENMFFYGLLETKSPVKTFLPCIGNHDVGNGEGDFSTLSQRQLEYMNAFVDGVDNQYYSKVINGYYLIFMAPDASESNSRVMSSAQLDWLEATLNEASKSGLPIFIFNHHPYTSIVEGGDRFQTLITTYPNTFLIVGHMHYYIHFRTIDGEYETPEIWVPCLTMMGDEFSTIDKTGLGYQMEVYDDEVCFRGRNYVAGTWTGSDKTYSLSD